MNDTQIKALAKKAACEAVRETFRMFGVDTEDQDSVNEFRSDLVFARDMRKTTKNLQSRILMVLVAALTIGGLTALIRGLGLSPK